ncbi:MAG TPA: TetR family transcriptional regulator [Dongiaceae bacterium]|nr:TetR family transcriptional regulator [Dongiaceae bacterium]
MARSRQSAARPSADAGPTPRWRRRAAARPQEILDAALTVFVTRGFAATRLDDVVAAAGISKGLLYRYFDNKAELFKEVVRQTLVATIRDVGDRARASGSALAALDIFLDQLIAVAGDERRSAIPKLVISESGSFPELAVFYLAEVIVPGLSQLTGLVRRGVESGEFRRVDPDLAARTIIAPLLLLVIWRHTFARHDAGRFDPAALIRQHRDILLHGLTMSASGSSGRRKRRSP